MMTYAVRRALQAIPLLIGISFAAFVLLRLAPGGPMAVYAQNPSMTEGDMRRIERILGLDQPIHVQYVKWATGMVTGNLGYSYRTGRPVGQIILERVPGCIRPGHDAGDCGKVQEHPPPISHGSCERG
jgi:peptide/nickel transport system permease protein